MLALNCTQFNVKHQTITIMDHSIQSPIVFNNPLILYSIYNLKIYIIIYTYLYILNLTDRGLKIKLISEFREIILDTKVRLSCRILSNFLTHNNYLFFFSILTVN
jgi:hypothetical protein